MIKSMTYFTSGILLLISLFFGRTASMADVTESKFGSFKIAHELTLPGKPMMIYDAITGDISGWWDHSFSESPYKLYIEPKPGGGFYEIFDESGDGVLHATVIAAEREKLLRFDGPLGLSGRAINIVCTYEFSPVGSDSTLLKLSVNLSGEIEDGLPETINQVWQHFLFERFKSYIDEGRHLLVAFEEDEKWGYKNNIGQVIIPPAYHLAWQFNTYGIAAVVDDSGWVYITMNGKRLLRPYIVDNGPDYFHEGLARFVSQSKIGFMDEGGSVIISANFEYVLPFSEGLAAFCVGCKPVSQGEYTIMEGGKWGYINKTGEIVVNPDYDKVDSFVNGKAEVIKDGKEIILKKEELL